MGPYPLLVPLGPIVFFDSHCLLCNRSVQFLLKVDKKELLMFASLSSDYAAGVLADYRINSNSIVYHHDGKSSVKSKAVLSILNRLRFPYSLLTVFYVIPSFIRDGLYDLIARNRKQWFGTTENCLVNSNEYKERIKL